MLKDDDSPEFSVGRKTKNTKMFSVLLLCFFSIVGVNLKVGFDSIYSLAVFGFFALLLQGKIHTLGWQLWFFIPCFTLSIINYFIWGYSGSLLFLVRFFLLVILGCWLFFFLQKKGVSVFKFRQLFTIVLAVHGLVILLQMLFPAFRDLIYEYSSVSRKTLGQFNDSRYAGLMFAGNAVTSTLHAIALSWALYFSLTRGHDNLRWVVAAGLLFLAVLLTGRTGMVLFILVLSSVVFFLSRKRVIIVYLLLGLSMLYFFYDNLLPTLDWLFSEFEGGQLKTLGALGDMSFFSDKHNSSWYYLLGVGSDGRDTYYLESDIGYAKFFLMFGLIGSVILLSSFAFISFAFFYGSISYRRLDYLIVFLIVLFVVWIGSYKEVFLGMKGITTYITVEVLYAKHSGMFNRVLSVCRNNK